MMIKQRNSAVVDRVFFLMVAMLIDSQNFNGQSVHTDMLPVVVGKIKFYCIALLQVLKTARR